VANALTTEQLDLDGAVVTTTRWGDGPVAVVLLHDGLGSIAQWRSIPADVADRTGLTVLAYDRPGHGQSRPIPTGPWPADWLHTEADRFRRLLDKIDAVPEPLVVGHSDGGSIALLAAAADDRPYRGVLTLAAHSWVEQTCFDAIAGMRADPVQILAGLARNHAAPAAVFEAWSGAWVSDAFRPWDIRPLLSTITCPVLVAQGAKDEYAAQSHATETASAVGDNAEARLLDGLGHLLHHQDPDRVVDLITEFSASV
jgi:pimeloyl-ACP methyl ester carboxylesterase